MLAVTDFTDDTFLLLLTANGLIKKTPLSRLLKLRATGLSVVKLEVGSHCILTLFLHKTGSPPAQC